MVRVLQLKLIGCHLSQQRSSRTCPLLVWTMPLSDLHPWDS